MTECPYCGTRIRKRAPQLERGEDGLTAKEPKREKARRQKRERRLSLSSAPRINLSADRPYASLLLVLAPAILLLVTRILDNPLTDYGAIVEPASEGPLGQVWWHYLTSPFVYEDIGYLFVVGVAVVLFGSLLEQRLGSIATFVLALGCGALGMLGAEVIETALAGSDELVIAAGGSGMALGLLTTWATLAIREEPGGLRDFDLVPIAVAATVLFALPLVEDSANVFAGFTGGFVGILAGMLAGLAATRRA